MPPVQVVGSVGRDQRDPLGGHVPDQEPDQVAGRAVRPLEVLDREHDSAVDRSPPEGAKDRVEQPRLPAHGIGAIATGPFDFARRAKVGHQAGEDAGDSPKAAVRSPTSS